MGAPESGIEAAEAPSAEALLSAFKTIDAAERRKHASLLNYWLSIRGDKEFPPLHDLDPLEISDAGPSSILLELISGGHDAEVRHIGEALRSETKVEKIIEAPSPSVLACIAKKLPIVAISRDFLAFEDEYETEAGPTRCWVTLLPLSAGGAWVDYVYALVSLDGPEAKPKPAKAKKEPEEAAAEAVEDVPEVEQAAEVEEAAVEPAVEEPVAEEEPAEIHAEVEEPEAAEVPVAKSVPGFTKLFDSLVGLTNFYGSEPVRVEPVIDPAPPADEPVAEEPVENEPVAEVEEPPVEEVAEEAAPEEQAAVEEPPIEQAVADEPVAEEPAAEEEPAAAAVEELELVEQPSEQPAPLATEGTLQSKLAEVRAMADEARQAKLRANAALYEGLGAAYDFALDAEQAPEEYLRLVEAEGLKIQLRSPMKPVAKLAFADMCDELTIKQLEAVLAWAFDQELPRGTLAERIHEAGGIARVLSGEASAAA